MQLIVVESPNKIKAIKNYLNQLGYKDMQVLASCGHVSNLLPKQHAVNVDSGEFELIWEDKANKYLTEIVKVAKKSSELIIATDPDREGEAIGWHVIRRLEGDKVNLPVKRLLFHSITKQAIKDGMEGLTCMRTDLVNAYKARVALDFLVGFYISPILWRKLPGCMSAGRVQSVILRYVTELEYERVQFKPEQYYLVKGQFNRDGVELEGKLVGLESVKVDKLFGVKDIDGLVSRIKKEEYVVKDIVRKDRQSNPPAPFITSTMQQEAASRLGFSPASTGKLAQQLYEGVQIDKEVTGLITYIRTDNVHMEQVDLCHAWIRGNLGEKYVELRKHKSKVRNAQEAHECIRPTNFQLTPDSVKEYLSEGQFKLYDLIYRRAVASQMASYLYQETIVVIGNEFCEFNVVGNVTVFDGYKVLYKQAEDVVLPDFKIGESVELQNVKIEDKQTQPPSRLNSASLIAKMEQMGIGRPSTYVSIIDKLIDREYADLVESKLKPSQRSWFVVSFLKDYFGKYMEYEFTAGLEEKLDKIAKGELKYEDLLREFWSAFNDMQKNAQVANVLDLRKAVGIMWKEYFFNDANVVCPKCTCATQLQFKNGTSFLSCSKYPECDWSESVDSNVREIGVDEYTGQMIYKKIGKYGPYLEWEEISGETGIVSKKRLAIPANFTDITLELAMKLKELPKMIGEYEGLPLQVGFGRYGPFLLYDKKFYSIKQDPLSISYERGVELLQILRARAKMKEEKGVVVKKMESSVMMKKEKGDKAKMMESSVVMKEEKEGVVKKEKGDKAKMMESSVVVKKKEKGGMVKKMKDSVMVKKRDRDAVNNIKLNKDKMMMEIMGDAKRGGKVKIVEMEGSVNRRRGD